MKFDLSTTTGIPNSCCCSAKNRKWLEDPLNFVEIKNPFGSLQINPGWCLVASDFLVFEKIVFWYTLVFTRCDALDACWLCGCIFSVTFVCSLQIQCCSIYSNRGTLKNWMHFWRMFNPKFSLQTENFVMDFRKNVQQFSRNKGGVQGVFQARQRQIHKKGQTIVTGWISSSVWIISGGDGE